jgi:ATP-dependent Clp protease ATP-binding subunit ClpC
VFNLLLQILEDGRLTDSYGRVVDFRNTILIMTSNIGTRQFTLHTNLGFAKSGDPTFAYDRMKETVLNELKRAFNPELVNRIDEVTVFHPLTIEHMRSIVELMLARLQAQLGEKQMRLQVDDSAKEFLIQQGFDPNYGARPLRRAIQRYLEDALAEEVLRGRFAEGHTIRVVKGDPAELQFEAATPVQVS